MIRQNHSLVVFLNSMGVWFFLSLILACGNKEQQASGIPVVQELKSQLKLEYAEGFEISYFDNYKVVNVTKPWKGAQKSYTYILADRDLKSVPDIAHDAVIRIPVKNLVCTSTSHLPMLEMIGEAERVIGFPNTSFITSETYIQREEEKKLVDVGMEQGMNIEILLSLSPEIVMAYGTGNEFDQFEQLERTGIPVTINGDYMESTPLGRAEWIKFIAAFFNKEEVADSIFKEIATQYLQLKKKGTSAEMKPTVFTGIMYGDTWFLPGGDNYAAEFFKDAGADYIWSDNDDDGWLELSYETVLDKAYAADFWLGAASFNTLTEMESTDHRYSEFKAFENKNVYNYNAKMGPGGGNAYLETGYARPDIILEDLLSILHPELNEDHELYFYKRLQ